MVVSTGREVMLDVKSGSNLTYLPLDKMIQQNKPANTVKSGSDYQPVDSVRQSSKGTSSTREGRGRSAR